MAKKYKINRKFRFEGKDYWIHADTEKEFLEKKIRKQIELEDGRKKIDKNMLFKDWADEWFVAYKEPYVSFETAHSYRSILRNHVLPVLGNMQLKSIKSIHVQKMLNSMSARSAIMLKNTCNLTKSIFKEAVSNNLIMTNPAENIKTPKGEKQSYRSITDYEREHILKVCKHHRGGTFIYIMLYAGLRTGEICCLRWKDIHFDEHYIQVSLTLKKMQHIEGCTKTPAGNRKVPLSQPLYDWLYPIKGEPFEYVVKNLAGNRMNHSNVQNMWRSFKRELNISMGCKVKQNAIIPPYRVADDLVMYCLRHTFCTDLQDAGVPINVAKDIMGHSDISVTAQIYTHRTERSFNAALNSMNEFHEKTM